tara:strand:+ start:1504 stop:2061 length:558 start_codon:yes stop_codon:yes gene_type:complete
MAYNSKAYSSETPDGFHYQTKVNSVTGSELISTATAKTFLRVDTTADDTIIGKMIVTARVCLENYLSRDIVAKNRTVYVPYLGSRLNLPFAPVASISSVTVEGSTAAFEVKGLDKEIILLDTLPAKDVKVTYITEGLTGSNFDHAILQLVSTYYDNRSEFVTGKAVNEIPTSVTMFLIGEKNLFI